jgi:molecular chaperone GrpE
MSDRKPENEGADEPFDAVAAAAELEASLEEGGESSESSDNYVDILESEIAAMGDEVAQARAVAEKAEARAERATEEVERAKERLARDAERDRARGARDLLIGFLDVLDDLDRAIAAARDMDHNPEVLKGVELVRGRFLKELGRHGVTHTQTLGQRFDPSRHDAVSMVTVDDPTRDGIIVGVASEGYDLGDEPLRPAKVAVGKLP